MMRNMATSAPPRGIAAIVGVGPKLGRSIARKFAHEGYTVAILARDLGRLSRFADEIAREEKAQVFAIRIDCSESRSVKEAFEGVLSLGFVEVLVYNAYQPLPWSPTSFADIRIDSFEKSLAVSSIGAFHCAQQVIPGMVERGRGTILFTGCSASLNGIAGFSELCCGKFALRALSQCLAREFSPMEYTSPTLSLMDRLAHQGDHRFFKEYPPLERYRVEVGITKVWTRTPWLKPTGIYTHRIEPHGPKRLIFVHVQEDTIRSVFLKLLIHLHVLSLESGSNHLQLFPSPTHCLKSSQSHS